MRVYVRQALVCFVCNTPVVSVLTAVLLISSDTKSVLMAARSNACTVFGRSNIGIAGSNPARGMDVCSRISVLSCPV
jgi:hypothetical protein